MSQPRLHDLMIVLFTERNPEILKQCLEHPDFAAFIQLHGLNLTVQELVLAFTHTSFSHEYQVPHQELAEFFGDAVVQLIVTTELMRLFPHEKEGKLSKLRSTIVNEKTLAQVARFLKLEKLLLVGKGEFKKELYLQDTVLSDTLEALMAKIFHHHGLEATSLLFISWLSQTNPSVFQLDSLDDFDAKSKLQEKSLAKYKTLPRYTSEVVQGGFDVRVWINDELKAQGFFTSKKIGEKELAQEVLKKNQF